MEQEETTIAVTGADGAGHGPAERPGGTEALAVGRAGPTVQERQRDMGELMTDERGAADEIAADRGDGGPGGGPDMDDGADAAHVRSNVTGRTAEAETDTEPDGVGDERGAPGDAAGTPSVAVLEQESEIAADYIEGLLDVADLDGDIDMDVEADRPLVSVVGATLEELVGPRGEVLEALQELTRLAVHRQTGARSRIMLDVGGYRVRRRKELTELGRSAADEVARTGVARRLDAMTPFERKIVHDAVAAAGLRSESEGEEPDRRVVVFPAG